MLRKTMRINESWTFKREKVLEASSATYDDSSWEKINLPHTYNAHDLIDDNPTYYRGDAVYRTTIKKKATNGKRYFLKFEAVNQDSKVFVNSKEVGRHLGGHTAFCFDITEAMEELETHSVCVFVSNAHNEDVLPLGGDLGHFGGIYRSVYLIETSDIHFDITYFGSEGVFATAKDISEVKASVSIKLLIRDKRESFKNISLKTRLLNKDFEEIDVSEKEINKNTDEEILSLSVNNPVLYSIDEPYLYKIEASIYENNTLLDQTIINFGFRSLSVDNKKGVIYNGKPLFLKGIGKHQDYPNEGYACGDDILRLDAQLTKESGANLLRSHYPLSKATYDECDRIGLYVWAKIPLMDKVGTTKEFLENTKNILRDVIYQNYNRPSFILWGYTCEPFGDIDWFWEKPIDKEVEKNHLEETTVLMNEIEDFVRKTDPTRLTLNDYHTDPTPEYYRDTGISGISHLSGWNIYQGWYHNSLDTVGSSFDRFHSYHPNKPFIVAEHGAESDYRVNTHNPTVFDCSLQYQVKFAKRYMKEVDNYPFVNGLCVWTLFDFQVKNRGESLAHLNAKGILRANRQKKDIFYLYKANWSTEKTLHIASRDWTKRLYLSSEKSITVPISVFSNLDNVSLYHNGEKLPSVNKDYGEYVWDVCLVEGKNTFYACSDSDKTMHDSLTIQVSFVPKSLNDIKKRGKVFINVGQTRTYFTDDKTGNTWLLSGEYEEGSFGYVGGVVWNRHPEMPAFDKIREGVKGYIAGTNIDPIYKTFVLGIEEYKINLPKGLYNITLHFVEPFKEDERKNNSEFVGCNENGEREFSVLQNGEIFIETLNASSSYGERRAISFEKEIYSDGEKPVVFEFKAKKGKTLLCGVEIYSIV